MGQKGTKHADCKRIYAGLLSQGLIANAKGGKEKLYLKQTHIIIDKVLADPEMELKIGYQWNSSYQYLQLHFGFIDGFTFDQVSAIKRVPNKPIWEDTIRVLRFYRSLIDEKDGNKFSSLLHDQGPYITNSVANVSKKFGINLQYASYKVYDKEDDDVEDDEISIMTSNILAQSHSLQPSNFKTRPRRMHNENTSSGSGRMFKGKKMPNRPLPPTPPSLPSTNTNSSGNKLVIKSPHTSKEQSINISGGRYEQNDLRNTSYIPFTTSRVNDATIDRMEDNLLRIIQQQEDLMRQRKEIENEILYLRQEYHRNQEVEYNYYGSNNCSCNQMNPYDNTFDMVKEHKLNHNDDSKEEFWC